MNNNFKYWLIEREKKRGWQLGGTRVITKYKTFENGKKGLKKHMIKNKHRLPDVTFSILYPRGEAFYVGEVD